jgi:hypothetical protein
MAISSLSEQTGAGPGRLKKGAICSHIGKLGETSTDFEVLCRKSVEVSPNLPPDDKNARARGAQAIYLQHF